MLRSLDGVFRGEVFSYKKLQLVDIPRKVVYDTVLDIPNYSSFLPWCEKSDWIDKPENIHKASRPSNGNAILTVHFALLRESYTSKVYFKPYEHITAVAADGSLFERLETHWNMKELEYKTLIEFSISFKFNHPLYQGLFSSFKNVLTRTMLEHFLKECRRRKEAANFIS